MLNHVNLSGDFIEKGSVAPYLPYRARKKLLPPGAVKDLKSQGV
jgi:hypothetical protein